MTIPDDWEKLDGLGGDGHSPSRYPLPEHPDVCQRCGEEFVRAGDRAGVIVMCPECAVTVFLL